MQLFTLGTEMISDKIKQLITANILINIDNLLN